MTLAYEKTLWKDHIESVETGEIIQYGTLISAARLNNMEDGIANAHSETSTITEDLSEKDTQIEAMQAKITALESIVAQLMTAFAEDLPARLGALESWKTSVQSGQDAVLIKYVPSETD